MGKINEIAKNHNLFVVEDAAQGVSAKYKGNHLGTIGTFGCYSFHETKNYICGEGGALVINDERFVERAEIIREKGTNRSKFFRGEVDKYTWVDIGSSFVLSDLLAAYLFAQLENMDFIKNKRKKLYFRYLSSFMDLEKQGRVCLPVIPYDCDSNFHMFYILVDSENSKNSLIDNLAQDGIKSVFHYVPLHSSPMGMRLGYKEADLPITEDVSKRLLRLPLYNDMTEEEQDYVINRTRTYLERKVTLSV